MQILQIKRNLFIITFLFSGFLFAQDRPLGSETVIVVKPYTPSVNDAFKIKETPAIGDSVSLEKKPVQYSLFSVPVASTFSPAKGQATTVERARPVKSFDNYVTLGFGTYSTALAEFYSNLEVNRSDNFGIFLTHNSSQGGIKDVVVDDSFYNTELNLNYNSRNRNSSWNTQLGLEHELINWYGISDDLFQPGFTNMNLTQNYYSAIVGGEFQLYDSFFERASATYRYFGDAFNSTEHNFKTDALFEVNIAEELITTTIEADIVNGSFANTYYSTDPNNLDYTFVNAGITPSLLILRDDLTVNLGASFIYSLNGETSKNSFYLYPKVTASYRLGGDYFIPYAGVEGSLKQNTYYNLAQDNPFVSPTLVIQPTDTPYDAYLGAKGKLTNSIAYNFRGSYISEFNKPLFLKNAFNRNETNDYSYGNSFDVVYDDITTLSFFAELNVDVRRNFKLNMNAAYFSYSSELLFEAWNLPDFKASIFADYQITDKWFAGANVFFIGERKDLHPNRNQLNNSEVYVMQILDSYIDLNANLGYRFNNQLPVFAKGNNLLGNSYERWADFPVQGIQVLAGATYKFDF